MIRFRLAREGFACPHMDRLYVLATPIPYGELKNPCDWFPQEIQDTLFDSASTIVAINGLETPIITTVQIFSNTASITTSFFAARTIFHHPIRELTEQAIYLAYRRERHFPTAAVRHKRHTISMHPEKQHFHEVRLRDLAHCLSPPLPLHRFQCYGLCQATREAG